MNARVLLCAIVLGALAPQVQAQQVNHPFYDLIPPEAGPTPHPDIGRGRLSFQTSAQRTRVERLMPRIEAAVAAQLSNPQGMVLGDLRTGRYQKVMLVCGVVDSIAESGETQKRRFIARPAVATLETVENRDAFRAGWKSTGCGV